MLSQEPLQLEPNSEEALQGALNRLQKLNEKISYLSSENTWLREQLAELKRAQFGRKSEKWETAEQGCFNEAELAMSEPESSGETSANEVKEDEARVEVPAHTKKRGHRKPLPENLPRELVKVELPPEERFSEDGTPLRVVGWEISEKLKHEPAKTTVVRIERAKYGVDSGDYVKTAPPIPSVIPKGIATPELLAAIVVSKYADGLPLYRIEEILSRQDIDLTRGTMARWMIKVSEALRPVWNVLSERLLEAFYVACDETEVQVLNEKGRKAETKSWMIVRSTPFGQKKIVLFDYSISRSMETINNLFIDYSGFLQCDGLNSYDRLAAREEITRIGCNMHGRRKFEKAHVDGAKAGKSLGESGLKFYKTLYDLEEEIKNLPPEERFAQREKLARPVWEEFKAWVDKHKEKVPIKSHIGQAFVYFNNEYEYLVGYLRDGRLNIDNGFTERAIRKFAIGRNNWLFSDSPAGAEASSLLYSLVVTAKINRVNPYKAFVTLLTEVPKAQGIEDFERLADVILTSEITH